MIQLFLIPLIIVALVLFPVITFQYLSQFLREAFAAEDPYLRSIKWVGFGASSVLFLISGTVVLSVIITLATGGTISVP